MKKNTVKSKTKEKSNSKLANKTNNQVIKKYKYGDYISKWSMQYWKEMYKKSFKKRSMFFIVMQLRNGKYDMFTVVSDTSYFTYAGADYYIDPDMVREDVHTGLNALYYHQDCTTPFKIDFNLSELRSSLEESDKEIVKAINPSSLKSFIHSQVIEKVMKGQELTNEMQFIKMITVINVCISAACLFIIAKSSGWI